MCGAEPNRRLHLRWPLVWDADNWRPNVPDPAVAVAVHSGAITAVAVTELEVRRDVLRRQDAAAHRGVRRQRPADGTVRGRRDRGGAA